MFAIPISARLASIALRLEPKVRAAFWLTLDVLFFFALGLSDTWAVANYTWWAAIRVFCGALYPLRSGITPHVLRKAVHITRRERAILGEIRALLRRSANPRIWGDIVNALKRMGGPETRKDAKDIYDEVAKPKIVADVWNQLVAMMIWAVLVTIFFRHSSPFALPQSHWLYFLVYPPRRHMWIYVVHSIWTSSSQNKTIQLIQLRALLSLQRYAFMLWFLITTTSEELLANLVYAILGNTKRFVWILKNTIASLVEQLLFELIFAIAFRLWNGPIENWNFSGWNLYLFMKAWGVFGSLWRLRREFPPSGLYETNWQWEKKYYYTALNNSCYSIRLLVLHPRVPGLDIRCTLFEVPLAKAPAYEAISYTWGDSSIREDIWVNSKRLNIPASAHKILSSRSSLWIPRLVWIDAICINQEDTEERNSQVILMKEVYSSAFVVSVCLQTSPAPENTNIPLHETTEAFLALDMLGEILMLDLTSFSSDLDVFLLYAGKVRTPRWLAFLEMVRNAWFERIWVVQEVALASSLRIFYGRSQIQWNHLVDVMRTCRQHPSLGSFLEATKDPLTRMTLPMSVFTLELMSEFRQNLQDKEMSFTKLLYESRLFKATEHKDYVFGLYGLHNGKKDERITPNYQKSKTEIYKQVARYLLEQHQPLRLLSYGGVGFYANKQEENPAEERLPTWCPNWSQQPRVSILSYLDPRTQQHNYGAGGNTGTQPESFKRDNFASLLLRGRILDLIVTLGPLIEGSMDYHPENRSWKVMTRLTQFFAPAEESWLHLDSSPLVKDVYPFISPPQPLREAFWRSLIGNRCEKEYPAPASCAVSFEKWVQFGKEEIPDPDSFDSTTPLDPDKMRSYDVKEMFAKLIPVCGINRRVCITKHGYIGMVPPLAVGRDEKGEGDVICLIRGAHVPFVLRPVPTGDRNPRSKAPRKKRFQLVGEAYIHGIMEGEMARWEEENLVEDLFEIV